MSYMAALDYIGKFRTVDALTESYARTLYALALEHKARSVLEIGAGNNSENVSGAVFAHAIKQCGELLSVDKNPENPAREHMDYAADALGVYWSAMHGDSTLMPLDPLYGHRYDVLYIDGDHRTEYARSDALNFYPFLRAGGALIMDDHGSQGSGVPEVVRELEDTLGLKGRVLIYDTANNNGHWYAVKPDKGDANG